MIDDMPSPRLSEYAVNAAFDLEVLAVEGAGDLANENVLVAVNRSKMISGWLLTGYSPQRTAKRRLRSTYSFIIPDRAYHADDMIRIWTKRGADFDEADLGNTRTINLFLNLKGAIWGDDRIPYLLELLRGMGAIPGSKSHPTMPVGVFDREGISGVTSSRALMEKMVLRYYRTRARRQGAVIPVH